MSEKKVVSLYRSAFQFLGQDATGEYLFFIAFQNASQVAGTYTTDDVMGNNSGIYHFVGDDTVKIQFNSLMPNAVVTKNGGTCNAAVHFVLIMECFRREYPL